ncbi:RidA family protein [Pseudomonas sp. LS-2]|jgi:enamine deaminase RidA (YjgF/YER057c/UK114 family)|nr:RidA family protein [Pseudomonas sp. LS-2]
MIHPGNASTSTGVNMRKVIKTGLPDGSAPVEWATVGGKTLYTASIPIHADGSIETGDIATQTELTLQNLKQTIEAAGGSMDDYTQLQVILTDKQYFEGMNAVYRQFFNAPFPNRATIIADLMVPGAKIEIIANAYLEQ